MATVPAILLSILLPAAEPLTPAELDLAVAALEEARSRVHSLDASFHIRCKLMPGVSEILPLQPRDKTAYQWTFAEPKERFVQSSWPDTTKLSWEWWFDGHTTFEWYYDQKTSGKVDTISIRKRVPREALRSGNDLAMVTGFRTSGFQQGIDQYARNALRNGTISGQSNAERWEIALGEQEFNKEIFTFSCVLEPQNSYRLVVWQLEQSKSYRLNNADVPLIVKHVADEFQQVADEASGDMVWFPLRAHIEHPFMRTDIVVDTVRINAEISADRFASREPPFGTTVREETVPGKPPNEWLAGGEAAREQRVVEMVSNAKGERERLELTGTTFDATPRIASGRFYWVAFGVLALALAAVVSLRARRAH